MSQKSIFGFIFFGFVSLLLSSQAQAKRCPGDGLNDVNEAAVVAVDFLSQQEQYPVNFAVGSKDKKRIPLLVSLFVAGPNSTAMLYGQDVRRVSEELYLEFRKNLKWNDAYSGGYEYVSKTKHDGGYIVWSYLRVSCTGVVSIFAEDNTANAD